MDIHQCTIARLIHEPVGRLPRLSALAVAVSLALGQSGAVLAQGPDVEEILVTGLRGEESSSLKLPLSLRDTPQSLSIITRESLDARQVLTLGQALELSAGVTQYSGNGPFAGQPTFGFNQTTIRGIQIDDIYDFRQDGFVSGSYYAIPDLAIYERVEVVKGPNSMLFGRGSAGGLINRILKKPLQESRAEIGFNVGSYDTYRVDADLTGPLRDNIQGRLVAAYSDSGSFVRGTKADRTVLAPSVNFELSPQTRLLLTALYQDEDIIPNTGTPLRATADGFEAPDVDERRFNGVVNREPYQWQTQALSAQLDHRVNDSWLASLRFNRTSINTPLRSDGYAYAYGGLPEDGSVMVIANDFYMDRDVWSGEVQVTGNLSAFGREALLSAGADWNENAYTRRGAYAYSSGNFYDGTFLAPDPETISPGMATESEPVSRGAYIQGRVKPTDRLAVLLGARYDNVKLYQVPYHPSEEAAPPPVRDVKEKITGRIGLTYALDDNINLYALYSQSFTPELNSTDIDGNLLEPQTGEIYEIGIKQQLFGGRLGLSAAVYRIDRENIATSVPDDPTDDLPPYSIASGLQRSDGFEIEINGEILTGWDLSLAFNQVNSDYKDPSDPLYGSKPGGSPGWQFGLYSAYEIQSGILRGLGFGATFFAIDERGIGYLPKTIPGYERTDLHMFYSGFENTEINLVVRNVTDERYIEGADRPSGYAQFGSPTAVMLTVRRQL